MSENKILIIIPVRLGSKRLPRKNILDFEGHPMFVHVAKEAQRSKLSPDVYICSESELIKKISLKNNLQFVKRPRRLSGDHIEKQDVIVYAVKFLQKRNYKPEIVVSLQANTPQFKFKDLDRAISFFKKKVFIESKIKEVISIGKDNLQNGAFRIMTLKTVFQKTLSTKVGVFFTDYIDIHTKKDYLKALKFQKKIKK